MQQINMIDTHCHLQFAAFEERVDEVIHASLTAGVTTLIVPSTDIPTSLRALKIARDHANIFVAVGIHPHHVFENDTDTITTALVQLEELLINHKEVVAVGEVGLDRHYYEMTKYKDYKVDESFIEHQKDALIKQIKLALTYDKSLILHNREAKTEFLKLMDEHWDSRLAGRTVFHCCEPDNEFISFAQKHNIFIGVDGDVTFDVNKQEFIKHVPIEMLVLETDSPFLTPEPVRSSEKKRPKNEPAYLTYVANKIAQLKSITIEEVEKVTTRNAQKLFRLPE